MPPRCQGNGLRGRRLCMNAKQSREIGEVFLTFFIERERNGMQSTMCCEARTQGRGGDADLVVKAAQRRLAALVLDHPEQGMHVEPAAAGLRGRFEAVAVRALFEAKAIGGQQILPRGGVEMAEMRVG